MQAFLLLLALAQPVHAGVAISAEAGANSAVPKISLQTSLSPLSGPALSATLTPGLNVSLAAPSLPAPLAHSAILTPVVAQAQTLSAASTPEAPKPVETAAAPVDKTQPSFKTKILSMLKSLANPFGTKSSEETPPGNEAERLDREFAKVDVWGQISPAARAEIEKARAQKMTKAAFKAYVSMEADAAFERMKAARGTTNIGLHFNLHGGRREDYVGKGINATMGDIALRYDMNADRNYKVYFFQSAQHGGYTPLDASNGEILFFPTRMGHTLNLFDLDAPEIKAAQADGRIKNFSSISMDFHGMKGVPYSAYLAPPVEVFIGTAKKIGMKRLTRDEETLATVRYLEAVVLAGGAFVPRP